MPGTPPKKPNWLEKAERKIVIFPPEAYGSAPPLPVFNEWNQGLLPYTRNCAAFAYNALKVTKGPSESDLKEFGHYRISIPNPGCMSGNPMASLTPENLRNALISDGCIYVPEIEERAIKALKDHYLIAAYSFFDAHPLAGSNMHFYRKSGDQWYQKLGHGYEWDSFVSDRTRSGDMLTSPPKDKMIIGPQKPGTPPPYQLAGFFWIPNEGIKLDIEITPLPPIPRNQIHWPLPER